MTRCAVCGITETPGGAITHIETTPELAADPLALAYAEGMAAFNAHYETEGDRRHQHCPYQPASEQEDWSMAGWSDAYVRRRAGNLQRLNAITTGRIHSGGKK